MRRLSRLATAGCVFFPFIEGTVLCCCSSWSYTWLKESTTKNCALYGLEKNMHPAGVRRLSRRITEEVLRRKTNLFKQVSNCWLASETHNYSILFNYTIFFYSVYFYPQKSGETEKLQVTYPLEITYPTTQGQYRMSYVLTGLKDNMTYNVSIYGINQYGDGKPCKITILYSIW